MRHSAALPSFMSSANFINVLLLPVQVLLVNMFSSDCLRMMLEKLCLQPLSALMLPLSAPFVSASANFFC